MISLSSSSQTQQTILIVEDNVFMANMIERKFPPGRFTVVKVLDAEGAQSALANQKISLILLDIVLPGIDGFAFLRWMKADDRFKDIPVIVVSNLGQQAEVERGLKEGAVEYLIKANTTPSEISRRVVDFFEKKAA